MRRSAPPIAASPCEPLSGATPMPCNPPRRPPTQYTSSVVGDWTPERADAFGQELANCLHDLKVMRWRWGVGEYESRESQPRSD